MPACDINVYPENCNALVEGEDKQVVNFVASKKNVKVPFPPMPLSELKKIVNLNQKPTNKMLKNAILLSKSSEEVKTKYRNIIQENKLEEVNCKEILDELNPGLEFFSDLGVNPIRAYTLASWKPNEEYFDLVVSILKNGLTCTYFKSKPKVLRINVSESGFFIPDTPLIMIANGSGIAPFRSIVEYMASLPAEKRVPLKLYYGIQR